MSQENVEIVRALVDHWNGGERDLTTIAAYFDPAIELESPFSSIAGGPYQGHAGMEQWARDVDEQFAEWWISLGDVREVGSAVIAISRVHGRGRASGVVLDFPSAVVAYFGSTHLMTRARIYLEVAEALKAVGLEE
jgi:hypothetical protein